jgi:apolipoprotein N-acyltransferase
MVLMADVPVPSSSGTLYTRTGDWFGVLCFLGMVAFIGYDFSWKMSLREMTSVVE